MEPQNSRVVVLERVALLPFDDLEDGDLLFARRAGSALDKLIGLTDDPFHHIGIVVKTEELRVVEFTFEGCTSRTVAEFVGHYDDVGVVKVTAGDEERNRIRLAAIRYLGTRPAYAWDEMFLTGMTALVRKSRNTKDSMVSGRLLASLERCIHRRNRGSRRAVFCTSFVMRVFHEAGVASSAVLGTLAPPAGYAVSELGASERDRITGWSIPAQMAVNLGSLLWLLTRAISGLSQATAEVPARVSSPSDYWRHVPAATKYAVVGDAARRGGEQIRLETITG